MAMATAPECVPTRPPDECPPAVEEVKCWGDGGGCGPSVDDVQRAACPGAPECPPGPPLPGLVWPGPTRDVECGRTFGTAWCFGRCNGGSPLCLCHTGVDFSMRPGTPVYAIYPGTIVHIGGSNDTVGYAVVIRHDMPGIGVTSSVYWHLTDIKRVVGDTVCAGERLGVVIQWDCGSQTSQQVRTHHHFAIWTGEPNFGPPIVYTTLPGLGPPDLPCKDPISGVEDEPMWPLNFIDPLCLLRGAPLATDACLPGH